MKHDDGTPPEGAGGSLAVSRAWADGLCRRLEQSAACYDYWDRVYAETGGWTQWRIWKRYGCFRIGLYARMMSAFHAFMDTPLERFD